MQLKLFSPTSFWHSIQSDSGIAGGRGGQGGRGWEGETRPQHWKVQEVKWLQVWLNPDVHTDTIRISPAFLWVGLLLRQALPIWLHSPCNPGLHLTSVPTPRETTYFPNSFKKCPRHNSWPASDSVPIPEPGSGWQSHPHHKKWRRGRQWFSKETPERQKTRAYYSLSTEVITSPRGGRSTTWKIYTHPLSAAAAKSLQSCPTLCDPMDGSPPGSPVPGILQARTLEWVAISFSTHCLGMTFKNAVSRPNCSELYPDLKQSSVKGKEIHILRPFKGFPDSSDSKESTCNAGDLSSIPGSGRSPGEGNGFPPQDSCRENPMDRGAWRATVYRVTKSRTRLRQQHAHTHKATWCFFLMGAAFKYTKFNLLSF